MIFIYFSKDFSLRTQNLWSNLEEGKEILRDTVYQESLKIRQTKQHPSSQLRNEVHFNFIRYHYSIVYYS